MHVLCVSLFSVFMHVTHGEPGNEAMSTAIFICDVSLCFCTICECDKWAEMIRMFILSFWASTWALKLFLKCIYLSIDHLNCLLGSFSPHSLHFQPTYQTKYHCTSPLAYKHCKLKWEKIVNTNTSPTHFQCTGYTCTYKCWYRPPPQKVP